MKKPLALKPKIAEKDFLKLVVDLAHVYGWKVAHFRPAMTSKGWRTAVSGDGKGFPDLVLAKGARIIFAELKTEIGQLAPEQLNWYQILNQTTAYAYVWRPNDFDEIEKILKGGI